MIPAQANYSFPKQTSNAPISIFWYYSQVFISNYLSNRYSFHAFIVLCYESFISRRDLFIKFLSCSCSLIIDWKNISLILTVMRIAFRSFYIIVRRLSLMIVIRLSKILCAIAQPLLEDFIFRLLNYIRLFYHRRQWFIITLFMSDTLILVETFLQINFMLKIFASSRDRTLFRNLKTFLNDS